MTIQVDPPVLWTLSALGVVVGFLLRSLHSDIKKNIKATTVLEARQNVMDGTTEIHIAALTKNIDTLTTDIKQLTANVAHMNGNMKVQSEVLAKVFEKVLSKAA